MTINVEFEISQCALVELLNYCKLTDLNDEEDKIDFVSLIRNSEIEHIERLVEKIIFFSE